ncbi:MAG: Smr/MutS family protein [Bryobacteraceae bacterium]|nr:Smr/MutS family protein [Bryobacteraceae bacterium]
MRTSSQLLEWEELKELLGRFIAGPLGRLELEKLQPVADRAWLEAALAELTEAIEFTRTSGRPPLSAAADCSFSVAKLRIEGAGLDGEEIALLATFLEQATETRSLISAESGQFPLLAKRAERMGDFRSLVREITGKILPNGLVSDDASVALSRLRREIEKQGRNIQQSLERFLRSHREEGVLQEEYVAIRNDRFVVPVVSGQRRRVDGVIHGSSGSGQTLFIEPLETIALNNELVRLREEELREIHRILRELTTNLRQHYAVIVSTHTEFSHMDLLFAKASFANQFNCVVPVFPQDGPRRLVLKNARHPLLLDVLGKQGKKVVPVSLQLDETQRILLISGPNTGGKTVSMKTAGLLALMAHAAMPVPASEAQFPIFDQVLADIGDQQSIEASLSSFSSHIASIREMVDVATEDSLVLLDELGRATDPEEGGALGVAILETFRNLGCLTLASTHLLALKVYGANTDTVLNGSMGFDEETLQPTYALRLGAPGKSAGLDIATRLGLPAYLIQRAREAMSTTDRDIARFLSELHARVEAATTKDRELTERLAQVKRRQEDLETEYNRRLTQKLAQLERHYDEVVANFEARALETIEGIKVSGEERKAVDEARRRVGQVRREGLQELELAITEVVPKKEQPERPKLVEGARVRLRGVRQPARIRRIIDDGKIEVDAGLMRMQVGIEDVQEVLPDAADEPKLPKNVTFHSSGPRWDVASREINVIGQRANEAVENIDQFLDQASLATVDRVRIVHGFGMGVLKRAVSDLLTKHPHVGKFYPATAAEGGAGATIAELRTD